MHLLSKLTLSFLTILLSSLLPAVTMAAEGSSGPTSLDMITSPAATNTGFHELFANSSAGGILALARGLRLTDDIIIIDEYGSNANAQHAVSSLGSNTVMSIFPNYSGPPISNGAFTLVRPGTTLEIPTFDDTLVTFDSVAFRFDQI